MGEAKRRRDRERLNPIVYHHTSILRTNLIWMSGVIDVENVEEIEVPHPALGTRTYGALVERRAGKDFPPLAWFTTQINVPKCLQTLGINWKDNTTGEIIGTTIIEKTMKNVSITNPRTGEIESHSCEYVTDLLAWHRLAIGFPSAEIGVIRWPDYFGYHTDEGRELNKSARDAGDNPDDWYVSEKPVDMMKASQIWSATDKIDLRMINHTNFYLPDVLRMVAGCRAARAEGKTVYIPPSWMKPEQIEAHLESTGWNIMDQLRNVGAIVQKLCGGKVFPIMHDGQPVLTYVEDKTADKDKLMTAAFVMGTPEIPRDKRIQMLKEIGANDNEIVQLMAVAS